MARARQSRLQSVLGFQVKVLATSEFSPLRLEAEEENAERNPCQLSGLGFRSCGSEVQRLTWRLCAVWGLEYLEYRVQRGEQGLRVGGEWHPTRQTPARQSTGPRRFVPGG